MPHLQLSSTQEAFLARLATASGRSEAEILDEALRTYAANHAEHAQWIKAQEPALAAVWDNDDDAIYDRL